MFKGNIIKDQKKTIKAGTYFNQFYSKNIYGFIEAVAKSRLLFSHYSIETYWHKVYPIPFFFSFI